MNMFDMMNMVGKAKELQARIKEIKENLVHLTAQGNSSNGMVHITVNGNKQIIAIDIKEQLLNPSDKLIVQHAITEANNHAVQQVDYLIKEEYRKKTEGLIPNIPGMDLGAMLGGI
jgi:DNA-binding YbaB/EbfC family protein